VKNKGRAYLCGVYVRGGRFDKPKTLSKLVIEQLSLPPNASDGFDQSFCDRVMNLMVEQKNKITKITTRPQKIK